MAICPNCGSDKFRYELRSAGTRSKSNYYRTGVDDSWIVPAGQKTYKSQRKDKTVGFCPDCGHIEDKQAQQKSGWYYVLCFMFWPFTLSVWFYRAKSIRLDKKWRALIIAGVWALFFLWAAMLPPQ